MHKQNDYVVGLIGQGKISLCMKRALEESYRIVSCTMESSPQTLATCHLIVYCSDAWSSQTLQEINRRCLQAGVALLPVYTQFGEGIIGPCVIPHQPGCISCAEFRQFQAQVFEAERNLWHQVRSQPEEALKEGQPWLSSFSLATLAAHVAKEIAAYVHQPDKLLTRCAILVLSLRTLECRKHDFLPVPACSACGNLVEDRAELAMITLQTRPKADTFTYRMRQPHASAEQIIATYVGPRTGLVSSLVQENTNLLPIASTRLAAGTEGTAGTGCTLQPGQSKVVSVLEVIERYAGLRPRGKRTTMRASYRQLIEEGQPALDPTTLGQPGPEQRTAQTEQSRQAHSCRQSVPYSPDLVYNWVWGYSFQRQAPLLVPEHCAYYGVPASAENPIFLSDVSNGCALGNCLEEAIFHGMLEVIERDAFLLMWYARLQVPRLQPDSITDPTVRLLLEHLMYHSGYTIQIFPITLDHAFPCLCLLGVDEQNQPGKPKALVAAGSHPHPEQALLKALREFAMYLAFPRQLDQQSRAQALEMLADASRVQRMDHHPLVYALPEAFERLSFLYHAPRQLSFQEAFHDFYTHPPEQMDLRADLEAFVHFYLAQNMDVVVVDQTAPEHQSCGLRCVKVLIPGMLPMTFGHSNRRVLGLTRLHQLPWTLGYQNHPLTQAEINPHPHPFF